MTSYVLLQSCDKDHLHLMHQTAHSPGVLMHDVVAAGLGHAVEGGGSTHGVGAHVLEVQPLALVQLWQESVLLDAVNAVQVGPQMLLVKRGSPTYSCNTTTHTSHYCMAITDDYLCG